MDPVYDTLLGIFPNPNFAHFIEYFYVILNCIKIVGKWYFDTNITFILQLNPKVLEKCSTSKDIPKGINGYRGVWKSVSLFPMDENNYFVQK